MSHTPGPWTIDERYPWSIFCNDATGSIVALTGGRGFEYVPRRDAETNANALLVAAAPDLLAVVKELEESSAYWSEYDVPVGLVDRIRAAIAKAEGRR